MPGSYVSVEDTVQGFKEILDGKYDEIPEQAFRNCGPISDVLKNAEKLEESTKG